MEAYLIHLVTLFCVYGIISLSYTLPVGHTGLLNLGHIGLFGVGSYATAIMMTHGFSFWTALLIAVLVTGLVGLVLALPTSRIKGDYYALMTLGFLFVANGVFLNWTSLTGGPFGIPGISRPAGFEHPLSFLSLVVVFFLATWFLVRRIVGSSFGKALEAVRDDDLVAESLGKSAARLRIVSLFVSALLVGAAGSLFAVFTQFVGSQSFWLDNALFFLATIMIGGLGSIEGAILGTVVMFLFLEFVRFLPFSPDIAGPLRLVLYCILMLAVVLWRPKGIMGRVQIE